MALGLHSHESERASANCRAEAVTAVLVCTGSRCLHQSQLKPMSGATRRVPQASQCALTASGPILRSEPPLCQHARSWSPCAGQRAREAERQGRRRRRRRRAMARFERASRTEIPHTCALRTTLPYLSSVLCRVLWTVSLSETLFYSMKRFKVHSKVHHHPRKD